jgi:excisionase family DNA binding protein
MSEARRLGTAKQAAAIHGVTPQTVRNWLRQGLISAVRVGGGAYRYDLDSVAALRIEYPCAATDERIRELVAAAPEFTSSQLNRLRLLLAAGVGAPNDGDA